MSPHHPSNMRSTQKFTLSELLEMPQAERIITLHGLWRHQLYNDLTFNGHGEVWEHIKAKHSVIYKELDDPITGATITRLEIYVEEPKNGSCVLSRLKAILASQYVKPESVDYKSPHGIPYLEYYKKPLNLRIADGLPLVDSLWIRTFVIKKRKRKPKTDEASPIV